MRCALLLLLILTLAACDKPDEKKPLTVSPLGLPACPAEPPGGNVLGPSQCVCRTEEGSLRFVACPWTP